MDSSREFWQFSDQIRLQTANLASLSIGDSIWSRPVDRRNLDSSADLPPSVLGSPDLNAGDWKLGFGGQKYPFSNPSFDRFNNNNSSSSNNNNNNGFKTDNSNGEIRNYFNKAISKPSINNVVVSNRKKNNNSNNDGKKKNSNNSNNNDGSGNGSVDKRFKTLPPGEALPRSEAVGGYIFVCNNDTMQENLKRQLFGLPPRYRDSVRAITPGLPLFLYNYSTHQLHGIFEASSFGGTNIDPTAWEDKKCPGESRFPAQVKVMTREICEPLEEDSFRPILHHYDGPKFRLELSVPEALALLDIFSESNF